MEFVLTEFIQKAYDQGKRGFGVNIEEEGDYEEAIAYLESKGIQYEVEPDNPAEVWIEFIRGEGDKGEA